MNNRRFKEQLEDAVYKYQDNHVDIMVEDDCVYGFFHSNNNSFSVTDDYSLKELGGMDELEKYEVKFERLCICES